jgi:hypothetical protein
MRWICLPLLLWAQLVGAASAQQKIEDLAQQVAPLWETLRPLCVMAVQADLQPALKARLDYLDSRLMASNLITDLVVQVGPNASTAWSSRVRARQDQLERSALSPIEREPLREYYFKLQTQTPSKQRSKLVADVQYMSEQLNMTLREQIWKSCHALGLNQLNNLQMEEAVQALWLQQAKRVQKQLHYELSAFYYYSFRSLQNTELKVIANVSNELKPWVDQSKVVIDHYFAKIRGQLEAYPMDVPLPLNTPSFPNVPAWGAANVHGLPTGVQP